MTMPVDVSAHPERYRDDLRAVETNPMVVLTPTTTDVTTTRSCWPRTTTTAAERSSTT